jgi:hypothetical protein
MAAIISRGQRRRSERGVVLLGVDLRDAREEIFVRMVCDGLAVGVAFARAGFTSKAKDAAYNLFNLPRVQERAAAILEARRSTGVVTLPQVTDMLQRVFAGAHSEGEYSAAHNAAFSLARLYGHVTDKATLEVIRRPSRDPDAPSEQALSAWVEALPALAGPGPLPEGEPSFLRLGEGSESPRASAPAAPLGLETTGPEPSNLNQINNLASPEPPIHQTQSAGSGPSSPEIFNEINWLRGPEPVAGRSENGAPSRPVTGTPNQRAQSELLVAGGPAYTPSKKTGLIEDEGTSTNTGESQIPSFEELFG